MKNTSITSRNGLLILLTVISPTLATTQAVAGSAQDAKIVMITATPLWEVLFVTVNKAVTNPPPCATATRDRNRFVVATNTTAGKATIASLMMAYATQKTVAIYGKGTLGSASPCDLWGDTESIYTVDITP